MDPEAVLVLARPTGENQVALVHGKDGLEAEKY